MKHVCIIEDMAFTRLALETLVKKEGFKDVVSYASAETAMENNNISIPKLYLLDINLSGKMTGIDFAREIRAKSNDPIIFLTALNDDNIIDKMLQIEPDGYILKPYNRATTIAAISIALNKYDKRTQETGVRGSILIKTGGRHVRFFYDELHYVSASGNYVTLNLKHHSTMVRITLAELEYQLPADLFYRVHKQHLVNLAHVNEVVKCELNSYGTILPISRRKVKEFTEIWHHFKNTNYQ